MVTVLRQAELWVTRRRARRKSFHPIQIYDSQIGYSVLRLSHLALMTDPESFFLAKTRAMGAIWIICMPSTAKRSDIPPDATAIRQFGEHLTWCEEPDTLHLWLVGTLDGKELHKIHEWIKEWANTRRYNFVFCDMSNLGTVTREARKVMNERDNVAESQVTTLAYGATFTVRVLADMAHRARTVMGITETSPTIFVTTEADARALRDQLRRQYG